MDAAEPIDLEALRFFAGPEGETLLARAAKLEGQEWQAQERLRRDYPAPLCRAALALVQLRRKGLEKFASADRMFFDRQGLEMASREAVARYRAERLAHCETLLDLCCGIGGDLLFLARQNRVTAVDRDPVRLQMARLNCRALDLEGVRFALADVRALRPRGDAVYIDPARRQERGRRVRRAADYEPPLGFIEELRRTVPAVVVKTSPAIDEAEIPAGGEVEFISAAGQCREAALYFGPLATAARRATLLPGGHTLTGAEAEPAEVAPPGAYVLDPDPAVVRAHLIDALARRIGAWKLDPQIAYLSADAPVSTPFARCYRVLDRQPFRPRRLRQFLNGEGWRPDQIKKRRFPLTPEQVRQRLGIRSGVRPVTLILTRLDGEQTCLICEKTGK